MHHRDFAATLRAHGLKATPQRMALLHALQKAHQPQSVARLKTACARSSMDTVTLYRALEAFLEAGLVRSVNLNHGHADYELVVPGDHHHHVICTSCGAIADVTLPYERTLERAALAAARAFASVTDHALEFFGTCSACAKRSEKHARA